MSEHPDVKISLSGGGSGNGIKAIIDGSTDIANASRFIKDKEVKLALLLARQVVRLTTYPISGKVFLLLVSG